MTFLQFLFAIAGVFIAMSVIMMDAWVVWRATRNAGWVDTIWTFGLGATGIAGAVLASIMTAAQQRPTLVAGLIVAWALRLGLHIANRTSGITDDPRYAALIRDWGVNADKQMFWLLQKQALVSIPLGMAMILAAWNPAPGMRWLDILGAAVLVVAIAGEALADHQLRRFKSNPANKDKVCDSGLWAWSRHPNYFFEWLGWIAYPLIALDLAGNHPYGLAAFAGPVCMYWLLVHVSGIPPLEEHMLAKHPRAFRAYRDRTNAFFPGPPRTESP